MQHTPCQAATPTHGALACLPRHEASLRLQSGITVSPMDRPQSLHLLPSTLHHHPPRPSPPLPPPLPPSRSSTVWLCVASKIFEELIIMHHTPGPGSVAMTSSSILFLVVKAQSTGKGHTGSAFPATRQSPHCCNKCIPQYCAMLPRFV